jgi:hypothetical protein
MIMSPKQYLKDPQNPTTGPDDYGHARFQRLEVWADD